MQFTEDDAKSLAEIVRLAAKQEILPRFRRLPPEAISIKTSETDLVTEADQQGEFLITREVKRRFPQATVIGEEAVAEDPVLLDRIADAEFGVIVDPIDGTWNYANGLPMFGVMLAVTRRGETQFGLLYDPFADDTIMAIRGRGAVDMTADGRTRRLRAAAPREFARTNGFLPIFLFDREKWPEIAKANAAFLRVNCLRCSCHEYRMLAEGTVSFCMTGNLKPWDHAPGQLIHAEAGGFSALFDGTPYAPTIHDGRLLLAPDEQTWEQIHELYAVITEETA